MVRRLSSTPQTDCTSITPHNFTQHHKKMNVPLLDLGPTLEEQKQEIIAKVVEVVSSTRYIQGPEVEGFEAEAKEYC